MNTNLATKNQDDYTITPTGTAYVSQRKAAEMCGLGVMTINDFFRTRKIDVKQGLTSDNVALAVQHYATKGRPEAIAMLVKFARAGAKAYIYHEAGYVMNAELPSNVPTTFAAALRLAADQSEKIQLDAPKVDFANHVIEDGTNMLVGDYAKLLSYQHRVNVGQNRLMEYLRHESLLMTGANGFNRNVPYQKYIDNGWFVVKHTFIEANNKWVPTTFITGLGQVHLSERIADHFKAK